MKGWPAHLGAHPKQPERRLNYVCLRSLTTLHNKVNTSMTTMYPEGVPTCMPLASRLGAS